MQVLFDLIRSLSKEEKRHFIQRRKNDPRLEAMFQAYAEAEIYQKNIDTKVAQAQYVGLSKAFYSMQKKELLEDLLRVLTHIHLKSIQNNEFAAVYSIMRFLQSRNIHDGVLLFFERKKETPFVSEYEMEEQILLIQTVKESLLHSSKPSVVIFDELLETETILVKKLQFFNELKDCRLRLSFIKKNFDKETPEELIKKAKECKQKLDAITLQPDWLDLKADKLLSVKMYYEVLGDMDSFHKLLISFYKEELENNSQTENEIIKYKILSEYFKSALKNGDFLSINSLDYKVNRNLDKIPEAAKESFLPVYHETMAIYYFFENETLKAAKEIETVLKMENLNPAAIERLVFYRLGILLGSNLMNQALTEYNNFSKKYESVANSLYISIIHVLLLIENKKKSNFILEKIDVYKNKFRKNKLAKSCIEALTELENFVEQKNKSIRPVDFYPPGWERIILLDRWLNCKREGKFYSNIIAEEWQKRRKKF